MWATTVRAIFAFGLGSGSAASRWPDHEDLDRLLRGTQPEGYNGRISYAATKFYQMAWAHTVARGWKEEGSDRQLVTVSPGKPAELFK